MKACVVYDSFFGNTEKIARAIAASLESAAEVRVVRVGDVKPDQLTGLDLLLVGSPTRGFRPSPATVELLKALPAGALQGVKAAAFDTRISPADANSSFLRFMVRLFGYAAEPIASQLQAKGAAMLLPPEGFFVMASEGPLKEGELERAAEWGKKLLAAG